ncbi:electron transfer flavoprotein subunit alpha/FixB family protein [Spartinivicinus poritis]|uniref:Electron transfer flavoprotein subunit alpha/FixB family protein n=1 Tax=Spartinivicinus poritis TaxID=2994640 RepID=A0ABT5UCI6_9GAMM|nr:electron transfer flavoprotein subunit alpha/FixB family protein [Spartinivicinus sp. A2-2]MDE1464094.1 electron transfer flavoprotein subunit alpha/FixB family protein [Spartinivicinus sp. A2-2]
MSNIIRRDPRIERIIRNRLHPMHANFATGLVRGPTGLIRKNPHQVGFIGPNGIKRIDRSATGVSAAQFASRSQTKGAEQQEVRKPFVVEEPAFYITVVLDLVGGRLTSHDKDILGQAHLLATESDETASNEKGAVLAIAFGELKDDSLKFAGIDRLLHFADEEFQLFNPELKLTALTAVEVSYQPKHWLLPDSIHGGGDLGRRLAARLNERPATQVWKFEQDKITCRASGGTQDIERSIPRIMLLAEEVAYPVMETEHQATPLELPEIPAVLTQMEDLGQQAVDPSEIPLGEAEFILSGGNGVTDWELFHQASTTLGATEGASRVAVDNGDMPRFRQVGATGTWVSARVYIAVGISGAIQHLQGIGQCEKVIAINLDKDCDMIKRADLSIIADSSAVLEELIKLVDASKQEATANAA